MERPSPPTPAERVAASDAAAAADKGSGLFYARRDARVMDYQLYERDGYWLRGPDPGPLADAGYIAFAGAAQTFGVYVHRPFPELVGNRVGAPHLNLGVGGGGPSYFTANVETVAWMNRSRFVVLQVLSGRSASNSLMRSTEGGSIVKYGGEVMVADDAWDRALRELSTAELWRLVNETRADWIAGYEALLDQLAVPVVLFYFSQRPAITSEDRGVTPPSRRALWQHFPQMVTRAMVDSIRTRCDEYVECVTKEGIPHPLFDRTTGEKVKDAGGYYPSPKMHEAAAEALAPVCRKLWR